MAEGTAPVGGGAIGGGGSKGGGGAGASPPPGGGADSGGGGSESCCAGASISSRKEGMAERALQGVTVRVQCLHGSIRQTVHRRSSPSSAQSFFLILSGRGGKQVI
jgi:hypothetical protein